MFGTMNELVLFHAILNGDGDEVDNDAHNGGGGEEESAT